MARESKLFVVVAVVEISTLFLRIFLHLMLWMCYLWLIRPAMKQLDWNWNYVDRRQHCRVEIESFLISTFVLLHWKPEYGYFNLSSQIKITIHLYECVFMLWTLTLGWLYSQNVEEEEREQNPIEVDFSISISYLRLTSDYDENKNTL